MSGALGHCPSEFPPPNHLGLPGNPDRLLDAEINALHGKKSTSGAGVSPIVLKRFI